jgi:hypothetical protein
MVVMKSEGSPSPDRKRRGPWGKSGPWTLNPRRHMYGESMGRAQSPNPVIQSIVPHFLLQQNHNIASLLLAHPLTIDHRRGSHFQRTDDNG